jgi:hypothetical protein
MRMHEGMVGGLVGGVYQSHQSKRKSLQKKNVVYNNTNE